MGAIDLNAIITTIAGFVGIFIGSWLNRRTSINVQKDFLIKQNRIEKLQEISESLSILNMEVLYIEKFVDERKSGLINSEEHENISERKFSRNLLLFSELSLRSLFISGEYTERIESLNDKYVDTHNKSLTMFNEDKNDITIYDDIMELLTNIYSIDKDINKDLEKELNELKK